MTRFLTAGAVFSALLLCGAELLPLTEMEKQFLPYQGRSICSLGKTGWKISAGENKKAISPDFDDSKWFSGQADCALATQGFRSKQLHTIRKTFLLPDKLAKQDLLLDLGFVSFYDKVYLNGRYLGSFGTYPRGMVGSSWVRRKYFIPSAGKWLKPGKNTLTLFIYPGGASGMYSGIPVLKKIKTLFYPGFNLKTRGRESLAFNLSDAEHLNNYRPGVPLNLEMTLSSLHPQKLDGKLRAEILSPNGKVLQKAETSGSVQQNFKTKFAPLKLTAPKTYGNYRFRMSFISKKKTLWSKSCALTVSKPVRFTLPVDRTLKNTPFKYNVSKDTTGHFGPRHHKAGKLVYDFKKADTRGGLAFSIRPMPGAPLLLMPNVCPSPRLQPGPQEFLRAKGFQFDGFPDAWVFGSIRPGSGGDLKHAAVESADWGEIKWNYIFEKGQISLTASTIHPALRVESSAAQLCFFGGSAIFGTGLPTQAAGMVNGKIFSGKADHTFPVSKLSENWLLIWFSGNPAYDQFDIPWLFVFKHKVKSLSRKRGFEFNFGKRGAGEILAMPLFGVTLQRPAVTAEWNSKLPADIAAKCRKWSRILAAAPNSPQRTFQVDFAKDQTLIHDHYTHRLLKDDWNTPVLKTAPVYPLLPLILSTGSIRGALHAPAQDLDYATSHGPLFAVPGNGVTIAFRSLLHFVSEVRTVKQAPLTKQTKQMISRLNNLMMDFLQGPLKKHPGYWLFASKKFLPGKSESLGNYSLSDVTDAFRYCAANITAKQKIEFKKEFEEYFLLEGVLPKHLRSLVRPNLQNKTVTATLLSPTGKKLTTYRPNEDDYGIDSGCWEALKIYGLWNYAYVCKRYQFIKPKWDYIRRCANVIFNAHDWAIGISYDSFSGIRVGNGLQETGIMHAGMAAMARLAHQLGDREMRDRASYYSVMQLCGLLGAMSANDYLRDHRPAVAGNKRDAETQFCNYYRKMHYVEFNENGGFTQYVMSAQSNLNSQSSYIMTPLPEVMRPYKEIFAKQTDDFFDAKYDHIPFNRSQIPFAPKIRQYMVNKYPLSAMELYERRKGFAKNQIESISDICAALDSLGEVRYKKLWKK